MDSTVAPGARVLIRDEEWLVRRVDPSSDGGDLLICDGVSELVRGRSAQFLTRLEDRVDVLDPAQAELMADDSNAFNASMLYIESVLRRNLPNDEAVQVFNQATGAARAIYPTSPAFVRVESIRLFLCGGGSRIPSLQRRFERIARKAANLLGITFQLSELVRPRDIVGKLESGFDRLSVAYGLARTRPTSEA